MRRVRKQDSKLKIAIAAAVRQLMTGHNKTLAEISEETGIWKSSLSRVTRAERALSVLDLFAICKCLDIQVAEFEIIVKKNLEDKELMRKFLSIKRSNKSIKWVGSCYAVG